VTTSKQPPRDALFVDLDGTLIASDALWEVFVQAIKRSPWILVLAPLWLLRGRAALKRALSERASLDAAALPYRDDVVQYVRERREQGSRVVLATASHRSWAEAVAKHIDLFDDIIATDAGHNLKGRKKLSAIERYCDAHEVRAWGYMGDALADLPIWEKAGEVHVVHASGGVLQRVRRHKEPTRVFGGRSGVLRPAIKALRPHQWVKNVLLFVPLVLARQYGDLDKTFAILIAFAAFSACASSVYVVNDILDIESDRHHERKKRRPFASGALPLPYGPPMAALLLLAGFGLAFAFLPLPYVGVLAIYLVVTSLYSTILKSRLLVDVLILASLYTLRIFAGGVAVELPVSEWLLAFSIFIFTSLAFAKRYVELARVADRGETTAHGRGYQVSDLSLIESFGATSGYLAVLVFALYINNGLPSFYVYKSLLWSSCPLLLFWISRLWFLAKRGELHDDPVVYAVTDKVSLAVGAAIGLLVLLAAPLG
jgi:4-hydroxybenzoate polyprenyltransferase/phosphoserine phosphatase